MGAPFSCQISFAFTISCKISFTIYYWLGGVVATLPAYDLVSDSGAYAWACIPTMLQWKLYPMDRGRQQFEREIGASSTMAC